MTNRLVIVALLVVGACKSASESSLDELASLRDKMCACKDVACADAVNTDADAFFKKDRARFDAMSGADRAQSKKLEDEQYACWKKLKHPE